MGLGLLERAGQLRERLGERGREVGELRELVRGLGRDLFLLPHGGAVEAVDVLAGRLHVPVGAESWSLSPTVVPFLP
ncbi:hypothetical protein E2C04_00765 [Nocardioides daphniae]|uniref:Uncharacterized protein n=1 Tax=Nocardioides daphniae TaxID=402297 RepID=A0A4P7U796_9ACTN|nr:hypothetical protein E2C04_00765 [Nocardioides daphniae]